MKNYKKLKADYEKAITGITNLFEKKQGVNLEFWVSDEIGGVGCFGDNYFGIHEIIEDMDSDSKPGDIFNWQDDNTDEHIHEGGRYINYASYLKGLRIDQLPPKKPTMSK
jgi:hypothetical protein